MAASYKAPSRHILHGVIVVPAAFLLASALNLALGNGILPGIQGTGSLLLATAFLLTSTATSYIGSKRGAEIYAHNQKSRKPKTQVSMLAGASLSARFGPLGLACQQRFRPSGLAFS